MSLIDSIEEMYNDLYKHVEHKDFTLYFFVKLIGILIIVKVVWLSIWISYQTLIIRILSTCFRRNLRKYGQWAVVTGSTDGIGKAYAIELARRNMDIILISRNIQKLESCANNIKAKYDVNVKVIQADFTEGYQVYDRVEKELEGLDIGILVNNVGIAPPHPTLRRLEDVDRVECWNELLVNNGAPSQLTRIILPHMKKRRRGMIVYVSSFIQIINAAWMTNYGSTKSFVSYYANAIREEVRSHNIQVQLLLPAIVDTNLSKGDHMFHKLNKTIKAYLYPNGETYARWASSTLGWLEFSTGYWWFDLQRLFVCILQFLRLEIISLKVGLRLAYGSKTFKM